MHFKNLLLSGLWTATLLQSSTVYGIPMPKPDETEPEVAPTEIAAPILGAYKTSSFNYNIPVPDVPAPPNSSVPINGTIIDTNGTVLEDRWLSNPEVRKRAFVSRPRTEYLSGFNIGTYRNNGQCKDQADWEREMRLIKSWSNGHFKWTVVKIFTTSQCNALEYSINAAKKIGGMKVWAGIWANPHNVFESDKNKLGQVILRGDAPWIAGVSVGSEELFRGTSAGTLAGYIWDVKGMIQNAYGKTNLVVGTSDSIGNLMNGANQAVIDASDAVMVTTYPYYGGVSAGNGLRAFKNDWWALATKMNGRQLIVGETGWPSGGAVINQAYPGASKSREYFRAVACWMRSTGKSFFWFQAIDEAWKPGGTAETMFGVSSGNGLKYSVSC